MKQIKNNFFIIKWNFATLKKKIGFVEPQKFVWSQQFTKWNLFWKEFLLGNMTFNVIYFCISQREMSNKANYVRPFIQLINRLHTDNFALDTRKYIYFLNKLKFSTITKKKLFFKKFELFLKNNFFFIYKTFAMFNHNYLNKPLLEKNTELKNKKINTLADHKLMLTQKNVVKAFLFLRSTRNNFFVTVIDNKGNTLITRTGGNSEWSGTRQWSTVFSADNAIYEACFLAKQRGVESLSVHIWSTFRLPQIKNSFDGLETADIPINELIYWPLQSFGGCWKKKPRWV